MKSLLSFLLIVAYLLNFAQDKIPRFNLDFEQNKHHGQLPDHWVPWGKYPLMKDTSITYSGKYSVCIESDLTGPFGSMAYRIPAKYEGETIRLDG